MLIINNAERYHIINCGSIVNPSSSRRRGQFLPGLALGPWPRAIPGYRAECSKTAGLAAITRRRGPKERGATRHRPAPHESALPIQASTACTISGGMGLARWSDSQRSSQRRLLSPRRPLHASSSPLICHCRTGPPWRAVGAGHAARCPAADSHGFIHTRRARACADLASGGPGTAIGTFACSLSGPASSTNRVPQGVP